MPSVNRGGMAPRNECPRDRLRAEARPGRVHGPLPGLVAALQGRSPTAAQRIAYLCTRRKIMRRSFPQLIFGLLAAPRCCSSPPPPRPPRERKPATTSRSSEPGVRAGGQRRMHGEVRAPVSFDLACDGKCEVSASASCTTTLLRGLQRGLHGPPGELRLLRGLRRELRGRLRSASCRARRTGALQRPVQGLVRHLIQRQVRRDAALGHLPGGSERELHRLVRRQGGRRLPRLLRGQPQGRLRDAVQQSQGRALLRRPVRRRGQPR